MRSPSTARARIGPPCASTWPRRSPASALVSTTSLDHEPEQFFKRRKIDPTETVEAAIHQPTRAGKARVLETDELSSVFGVDIETAADSQGEASAPTRPARKTKRAAKPRKPAASKKTAKKTTTDEKAARVNQG